MNFVIGKLYSIQWHAEGASLNTAHDGEFLGTCTRSDGWVTLRNGRNGGTRLDVPESLITSALDVTNPDAPVQLVAS